MFAGSFDYLRDLYQLKQDADFRQKETDGTIKLMSRELIDKTMEINALIKDYGVPLKFRGHYVNYANGDRGLEMLIARIFLDKKAIYSRGVEKSPERFFAISGSLFIEEIIREVRKEFGYDRYPDYSIYTFVSVLMPRWGVVGKIKLSNGEDCLRHKKICRPRTKFYLIRPEDLSLN